MSLALASGFVEQNTRCDGGVERLDRTGGWNGDAVVALSYEFRRQSAAFIADEDGDWLGEIELLRVGAAVDCGGDGPDSMQTELFKDLGDGCGNYGEAECGARRGSEGLGIPDAHGSGEGHDSGCAEGFGRANNGAEVARILKSGGDDDQGLRLVEDGFEGELWSLGEGGDGLRRFGGDGAQEDVGRQLEDFGQGR